MLWNDFSMLNKIRVNFTKSTKTWLWFAAHSFWMMFAVSCTDCASNIPHAIQIKPDVIRLPCTDTAHAAHTMHIFHATPKYLSSQYKRNDVPILSVRAFPFHSKQPEHNSNELALALALGYLYRMQTIYRQCKYILVTWLGHLMQFNSVHVSEVWWLKRVNKCTML